MKSRILFFLAPVFLLLIVVSCAKYLPHLRKHYTDVNAFIHRPTASPADQPFLKNHFKNGHVAILHHPWEIDTVSGTVNGTGFLYNENRTLIQQELLTTDPLAIL